MKTAFKNSALFQVHPAVASAQKNRKLIMRMASTFLALGTTMALSLIYLSWGRWTEVHQKGDSTLILFLFGSSFLFVGTIQFFVYHKEGWFERTQKDVERFGHELWNIGPYEVHLLSINQWQKRGLQHMKSKATTAIKMEYALNEMNFPKIPAFFREEVRKAFDDRLAEAKNDVKRIDAKLKEFGVQNKTSDLTEIYAEARLFMRQTK